MSNSRTFGLASGNHITTDLGDIPTDLTDDDFTAIVVFRRGTSGNGRGLLLCGTNTSDGECFGMWVSSNERLFTNVGDGWNFSASAVASLTETWYFGAMTVGSVVRVHLGNLDADTWGHGNTGSPINPTTLKDIKIGNRTPSPTSFDGDIAFAAIFEEEFTDQQIENLAAGVFASLTAGATAAWLLNQADVGDPVLDLVGDADQSAISGTAVSSETPEADGFSYSLTPPNGGGTHYERSAGTLQFGLSLETPSRKAGFGRSAEPLQFALALGEPSRIASHQRSASPMQFELAFGSVHHGDIMFEPELEGDGSISDQIMASLITQGFDTGSLLDRERARLLAKLSFTPVGLSNSGITYSTADLYRLAEETPRLIC